MMAKRLSPVDVAHVHFHYRTREGQQRIEERDGRVSESRPVDDQAISFPDRFLHPVDKLPFGVALPEIKRKRQALGFDCAPGLERLESVRAVSAGIGEA